MFKFFDPNSECFAKYDKFCSHSFNYACLRRKTFAAIEEVRNYRKIVCIKNFLKMAGGRMHAPHPTPLDSLLAISSGGSRGWGMHSQPISTMFLMNKIFP